MWLSDDVFLKGYESDDDDDFSDFWQDGDELIIERDMMLAEIERQKHTQNK